jgi:tol-pal system protein YbgF
VTILLSGLFLGIGLKGSSACEIMHADSLLQEKTAMKRICFSSIIFFLFISSTAFGGTKEEIMRLQNDVLALQNQLRMLDKTLREQTDGLRSLLAQLNDQAGKTNLLLTKVTATLESQASGDKTGNQAVLQEIRNLSGKLDDASTRISALAQQVADMKVQSKPISQRLLPNGGADGANPAIAADQAYNEAFNDLIQGNLDMAIEGFTAFIRNYPTNEKADDAQYNIGEAYYNSKQWPQAVAAFTRVVNEFPNGDKLASAYFKRAKAELATQDKESAVADFKTVTERFDSSPEAGLAQIELEKLGVSRSKPPNTRSRKKP